MRVVWTRAALDDLDRIQDFIAQDSPPAAYSLASNVIGRVDGLPDNPMMGRPGRASGTRELVALGTPYIVVYRLREAIEVLAVIHGAREWPEEFGSLRGR